MPCFPKTQLICGLFKCLMFIRGQLLKIVFSSIPAGARAPRHGLNNARQGSGRLPQRQLQGALQHHGGQVDDRLDHFDKNVIIRCHSAMVCQKLHCTANEEHCAGLLTRNTTRSCRTCGTRRITRKPRRFAPGLWVSTTL